MLGKQKAVVIVAGLLLLMFETRAMTAMSHAWASFRYSEPLSDGRVKKSKDLSISRQLSGQLTQVPNNCIFAAAATNRWHVRIEHLRPTIYWVVSCVIDNVARMPL